MPNTVIVESVYAAAVREINALEHRIAKAEDDADAMLWGQAAQVVAQLDAGLSHRDLAKQWINARTGEPDSHMHVSLTARLYRGKFTLQPRPRFRDAYNEIANPSNRLYTTPATSSGIRHASTSSWRGRSSAKSILIRARMRRPMPS